MCATGEVPNFVYTVPNFANPTGAVMSAERRTQLVALATKYNFDLI